MNSSVQNHDAIFVTTHWTMVLSAANGEGDGVAALEKLCQKYWYPVYAFVRRRGSDAHTAEDLTQSFFAHLLEKEALKQVSREKGKFRSFLLAACTNFLNNEWDKRQTLKRGGRQQIIFLDALAAEERYRHEPVELVTPEKLYERRWALALLGEVALRLKSEYAAGGKAQLFAALEPFITGQVAAGAYAGIASSLGMKEEAVRMALSRLRRQFGEVLRSEIAHTVATPAEVDEEIRHLFAAIG